MKLLGKILTYLFTLAALAVIALSAYLYLEQRPDLVRELPFAPKPCAKPLVYTLGTFDESFGITKEDLVVALTEASALWNDAEHTTILTYSATPIAGSVPVNLIYDSRQKAVALGKSLQSDQQAFSTERGTIDSLESKFTQAKAAYDARQAAFGDHYNAYQAEVAYQNSHGGASPSEYTKLQSDKAALQSEQAALDSAAQALKSLAAQVNAQVGSYNATVRSSNQKVDAYNEVAGSDFDQGEYVEKGSSRYIDIYAFKTHAELVHALAHELGHALGLAHNTDPASIMYPYNESSVELSTEDTTALQTLCGS